MILKVSLTKKDILRIFRLAKKYKRQHLYLICLYRICLKRAGIYWNKVEKYENFPKINSELGKFFWDNAIKFDREFHPNVMPGGLVLNNGFSLDETLPENTVTINTEHIRLK